MRRLLLLTALLPAALAAPPPPRVAARWESQCPAVQISCPEVVRSGEDATFTAAVGDADPGAKLTYNWVVSAGTIRGGQGTSSVTVDTTGVGQPEIVATVTVGGLPASCAGSASCATPVIESCCFHDKIDEYGNIRFDDEKARLDNFAIELQNWPEGVGYIVAYGGRRARRGEARRRAERAKRYITDVRGIPAARVVTIDGGYREDLTVELKLRAKRLPPPEPYPTVDPKEVRFIKAGPARRARRR